MNKRIIEDVEQLQESYASEIALIIRGTDAPKVMREKLMSYHENDVADVLEELSLTERKKLYRVLGTDALSYVFEYVEDPESIAKYLEELDIRSAVNIVSDMDPDLAADVLAKLGKEKRAVLVDLLDEEVRRDIRLVSSFDEEEIGSRMTTDYVEIPLHMTAGEAMESLSVQAQENDNISTIYVNDEQGAFYGAITLRDLLIAPEKDGLDSITVTSFPYVYAHEEVDDCISQLRDYSEASIPVLDDRNRVLGILTAQDIMDMTEEEMGEDYARLAGLTAESDLKETTGQSIKKRIPWLVVLLGLGLIVSTVVGLFEGVVARLPMIIAFQSLVLDMAGNVGTQSLAVTIRVLADDTIKPRDRLRLVPREGKVALLNGVLLGVASFLVIGLYLFVGKGQNVSAAFAVSGCIGCALLLAMMISGLCGTLIPIVLKKLNFDPAVASGPLITTVNDLVAAVVYYGLSWFVLLSFLQLG